MIRPAKIIIFFLFILCSNFSFGQDKTSVQESISLNHFALHVHDLEKSRKFYEDIVGLKRIPEPFNDGLHEWFNMGGSSQLHLIGGGEQPDNNRNKNTHMCFTIKSIDDFIANLEKNNIPWSNWVGEPKARTLRVDGVTQIYFKDPDGYWLEINNAGFIK